MGLAYERRGHGDPLLLVHGTGSQRQVWDPLLDRLAAEREVIAPDLPGFGETPPLSRPVVTPEDFAGALAELLDDLSLGAVHVAGHSLGGGIALALGASGRGRSVTALSPIGFWTPQEANFCRRSLFFAAAAARASGAGRPPPARQSGRPDARDVAADGAPVAHKLRGVDLGYPKLGRSPGMRAALDGCRRGASSPTGRWPAP